MTKKDYTAAARIAAPYHEAAREAAAARIAAPYHEATVRFAAQEVENAFVLLFKQDGGRFDEERFREACRK